MTQPIATSPPAVKFNFRYVEIVAGLAITLLAMSAHVYFSTHAGGLWRDEANSANMATASLGNIWEKLHYDTFPLAHVLMLKIWATIFGSSDASLRFNGMLIGVALLGAVWWCAKQLGIISPVIALALAGMNAVLIRYGDSLRPYGMGAVLGVLGIATLWRFCKKPSIARGIIATIVCILNVHTSYQNCTVVFGCCMAAAMVAAAAKDWKTSILSIIIGAIAALSILIYVEPLHAAQDWMLVLQTGGSQNLGSAFAGAFGGGFISMAIVWLLLVMATIVLGIWGIIAGFQKSKVAPLVDPNAWRELYCMAVVIFTTLALIALVVTGGFQCEPWHILPLLAPTAISVDVITGSFAGSIVAAQIVRVVIALLLAIIPSFWSFPELTPAQTNIDVVADLINKNARKNDIVVVAPWFMGVSFSRYYHGQADWMTLPPMTDHSIHRYDLIKAAMLDPSPIEQAAQKVAQTLVNGGRVWIAGPGTFLPKGQFPDPTPIPPNSPWGWKSSNYTISWESKVGVAIQALATQIAQVPVDRVAQPVENLPLIVVWRAPAATSSPAK
ncbi:MAG TPA: hypothetical protein VHD56_19240 [Tepidisphaeraceae bacterium]|nr:hypothetical protein [Tepidisphaeraceae bacterium]